MNKIVMYAASCYNQKYYFNTEFEDLPIEVKNEIKTVCVSLAEKLHCIFVIGFYVDGTVYIETQSEESDYNFDDIGSQLEIKKLQKEKEELFKSLKLWYNVKKIKS